MKLKSKLIYSVKELFTAFGNKKFFRIPSYQRGYKWNKINIEQLLDDIDRYHVSDETFYCLQNITLVDKGDSYHVVDGQQRLTTLAILLSFLEEYDLVKNKIDYQVRSESNSFLNEYICNNDDNKKIIPVQKWDDFLKEAPNKDDLDYQDIYYMYYAYQSIQNWFGQKDKNIFKDKLLNKVCLIVNLLAPETQEQETFKNLNGGKIDLDGADLIRAIVVTREASNEVSETEDKLRSVVMINENRVRIGNVLDEITRWWSDPVKQNYFKYFIKDVKVEEKTANQFQDDLHPINYLYKLLFLTNQTSAEKRMTLQHFEKKMEDGDLFYDILNLQRLVEDWYEDRVIYHLLLYVNIYCKKSFKDLIGLWKTNSRDGFINELKEIIYQRTISVKDELQKKSEIEYLYNTICNDETNKKAAYTEDYYGENSIIAISVLLDIIDSLNESLHLPNLKPEYFELNDEDREHIFPQTPVGKVTDKSKATKTLINYIKMIKAVGIDIEINEKDIKWDDDDWKNQTTELINSHLMKIIPLNSIGNICLLNKSVNRSYGNDFYTDKRSDIISKSRKGYYIRPHTIAAFDKAFLDKNDDDTKELTSWSESDILNRRKKIIQDIYDFIK